MPDMPPTHKPQRANLPDGRPNSAARGYGPRWRKLRLAVLARDPICQDCGVKPSTCVDHVITIRNGGTSDESNLRGLCRVCHGRKGVAYDGAFGRPKKGPKG